MPRPYFSDPLFRRRLPLAIAMGATMAILTYLGTWRAWPTTYAQYERMFWTQTVNRCDAAVAKFQQEYGRPPKSLDELRVHDDGEFVEWHNGVFTDFWENPILYSVREDRYRIVSLGRDGKPGGVTYDCDVSNDDPNPDSQAMPLRQFAELPEPYFFSGITFLLGTALCQWLILVPVPKGRNILLMIAMMTVAIGPTLLVAICLSFVLMYMGRLGH